MFWNDPNLYGFQSREIPSAHIPFFGTTPWQTLPWTPRYSPFPMNPFAGMPTIPFPQVPQFSPYLSGLPFPTQAFTPFPQVPRENVPFTPPYLAQGYLPYNPIPPYGPIPFRPF